MKKPAASRRIRTYTYPLASGIRPTPEFAKKGLAQFAVNVGTKCGHGCTYCSTPSLLRCHRSFRDMKESPFGHGYAIVDPDMPAKVAHDAAAMKKRGLVQLCTTVDAWSPEAQKYDLGRRCLEAILSQPGWTVRILTKNAAVTQDFDFIKKYRDRVLVGLSLTGTAQQNDIVKVVEPYASSISERMAAMVKARKLGLRTYGMLCPLLPGIANGFDQVSELIRFVKKCGAEDACLHGYAQRKNPDGSRGAKNVGL